MEREGEEGYKVVELETIHGKLHHLCTTAASIIKAFKTHFKRCMLF